MRTWGHGLQSVVSPSLNTVSVICCCLTLFFVSFFFINPLLPEMSAFSFCIFFPSVKIPLLRFTHLSPHLSLSFFILLLIHDSLFVPFILHLPSTFFCMYSAVLGTRPHSPQRPLWSTSHPLRVFLGLSSDSKASSSPWPPGPLRRPTTPLPPHRAWGSYTVAPGAAGGSGGVQDRGQGAAQPHPGHLATERAQGHVPALTRAAGITWWGKYAPGAWMSNLSCEYMTWNFNYFVTITLL